ncbi:MAG: PP2C family protein-serine/threonine phosphatase [Eubacterium sp.]|nr:PP2C family protein-serine/threonine phosphatase [Eubacterium sp.]
MEKDQAKKKRGSLLLQIGIIFALIFFVVIPLFIVLQVVGNTMTYMEAKQEYLTPIMKNTEEQEENYINNLDWFMRYWREHPKEVKEAAMFPSVSDMGAYVEDGAMIVSTQVTPAILDALPEDKQLRVAGIAYYNFNSYLSLSQRQLTNEVIYIFDVHKDSLGFIYDFGKDVDQHYLHLGEMMWDEEEEISSVIREYVEGKTTEIRYERFESRKDGTYYYAGYYPVVKNGEIAYVIGVLHDWSEYHSTMIRNMFILIAISVVLLIVSGFILLHFVNQVAVKPLKKVQNAVREYRQDKNSEEVIEKMKRIKQRNELGELSSDVTDLAVEIDRYNAENAHLIGERKRVEAELSLAAAIQSGVLPKVFPEEKDYQLFASMSPAKEVGGDFYDFFSIDETHVGLAIGDVSGKGVPASLFMMITKLLIKQYAMAGNSAAEVLRKANESICAENERDMFVTAWFGIMDRTTGKITAASAGHEYPIIRDSDEGFRLIKDKHGFVLGGMDISRYKEYEIQLNPGTILYVYTDGAAEATNGENELFGTDRMLDALNGSPGLTPEELCHAMTASIDAFVGDAPQFDDLTMLCVRYNGQEPVSETAE